MYAQTKWQVIHIPAKNKLIDNQYLPNCRLQASSANKLMFIPCSEIKKLSPVKIDIRLK